MKSLNRILALAAGGALLAACGGSTTNGGSGGSGAQAGAGGTSGSVGVGGTGGGSSGTGGFGASASGGASGSGAGSGAAGFSGGAGGAAGSTSGSGGSSGSGGTGGGTQGASCAADPSQCALPPGPSTQPPNTTGQTTVIAVSQLFFGDTDRSGNASPVAWKQFGYNLDGLVSTKTDVNHCRLVAGANPTNVKTDGDGGIDNSFGSNLMPLFTSLSPDFSTSVNQTIADGTFTELIRLDNFLDPVVSQDQNGIAAALYGGADRGSPAAFDGSDVWPVTYESVSGGDVNNPMVKLPTSYVAGGLWVSGSKGNVVLPLDMSGYTMSLTIAGAIVSMRVTGTGPNATAVGGTIAGVIDTEQFISELAKVVGSFDTSLCTGPTFDSIAQQIRQASDIMKDGTNGDPSKTCDAISIGLGFNGHGVTLGDVAAPATPPPDPCAP